MVYDLGMALRMVRAEGAGEGQGFMLVVWRVVGLLLNKSFPNPTATIALGGGRALSGSAPPFGFGRFRVSAPRHAPRATPRARARARAGKNWVMGFDKEMH